MGYAYKRFSHGMLGSNTYLLWETETGEGLVIDPGNPPDEVEKFTSENNISVKYIALTHAHYDHVLYIAEYKEAFGAPCACTQEENHNLTVPYLNASTMFGSAESYEPADIIVDEGYRFGIGADGGPTVIKTPGHTSGGICISAGNLLFTGDTLFYGSFGRTDLGDGSTKALSQSIDRLYAMDDDTVILPGHGTFSTIGRERRENPFWEF